MTNQLPSSSSPVACIPKPRWAWVNRLSGIIIRYLLELGIYYRRRYGINDKHINLFDRVIIHELPFNLLIKRTWHASQEAEATMTAHAMGVPTPRVLCYADYGPDDAGYILMTKVPGETLWNAYPLYSEEQLDVVLAEIGVCLQKIRRFASPYGDAVCGFDGKRIYNRLVPNQELDRFESPQLFHRELLEWAITDTPDFEAQMKEANKFMDKTHRVVLGHGDLLPTNIIVRDGHLTGIIDWGCAGWYPEYWDYVNPMPAWPKRWQWATDLTRPNSVPSARAVISSF